MFGYALSEHEPSQSHIVLGTLAGHEADTCICLATPFNNQAPPSPIALRIASVKEYFPPQLSWVVTLIIPCTFAEFERNQISVVCLLFLRKMAEKNILNNSEEKETRANWTSDAEPKRGPIVPRVSPRLLAHPPKLIMVFIKYPLHFCNYNEHFIKHV